MNINSDDYDEDRCRMLAEGASLVRLVNTIDRSRDFVLLALYFAKGDPDITQYFLYQSSDSNNAV